MFGNPAGDSAPMTLELPQCADWSLEQKLNGERDTLGHYLSGHPLDPYRDLLRQLATCGLDDLERVHAERKFMRGAEGGVVLAGLVTGLRKRGDSMAFVHIEDGFGRIECAFFRDACLEFGPLLTRDRIVLIEGYLQEDEFTGGYSLRARQAWDFKTLCSRHARLLSLSVDTRESNALADVERLLATYRPGTTPLRLDLITADARGDLDCNGEFGVRAEPELLGALRAVPGVESVNLLLSPPWSSSGRTRGGESGAS
jgi:DNA polymerase-3 subunit alpha